MGIVSNVIYAYQSNNPPECHSSKWRQQKANGTAVLDRFVCACVNRMEIVNTVCYKCIIHAFTTYFFCTEFGPLLGPSYLYFRSTALGFTSILTFVKGRKYFIFILSSTASSSFHFFNDGHCVWMALFLNVVCSDAFMVFISTGFILTSRNHDFGRYAVMLLFKLALTTKNNSLSYCIVTVGSSEIYL